MTSFTLVCGIGNSEQGKSSRYENGALWSDHGFSSSNGDHRNSMHRDSWWNPAFHVTLIPSKVEHLPVAQHRIVFINCSSNGGFIQDGGERNDSPAETVSADRNPSTKTDNSSSSSSSPSSSLLSIVSPSVPSMNDSLPPQQPLQQQQQQQLNPPAQKQHQASPYYIAVITSVDSQVAIPTGPHDKVFKLDENRTDQIMLRFLPSEGSLFTVQAVHVGYGVLVVQFYDQWDTQEEDPFYWNLTNPLYELYFSVSVVRKVRWVDMTFDCVIAAVATLNAFSVGCDSDWASLHQHLKKPTTLLLATGCQMIINPLVSKLLILWVLWKFNQTVTSDFHTKIRF